MEDRTRISTGYLVQQEEYLSTSYIANNVFFPTFDAEAEAERCIHSRSSRYYSMTKEEVLKLWDNASNMGTRLHALIEQKLTQQHLDQFDGEVFKDEMTQFEKFLSNEWRDIQKVYKCEEFLFDEDSRIAGTYDCVSVDVDGNYYLYDWKRTLVTQFNYGYGSSKYSAHLENSKYNRYSVQLNIYAELLRRCRGIDVQNRMYIVSILPDLYEVHKVKVIPEIEDYFIERST